MNPVTVSPSGAVPAVLVAAWGGLLASLAWRARARRSIERRRDPVSVAGLLLEGVAFGGVFLGRDAGRAIPGVVPVGPGWMILLLGIVLLAGAILLIDRSLRELGSQWRVVAAVAQSDRLVRTGPYVRVRHPVYTAMAGMLVGTGVLIAPPEVNLLALGTYALGTGIRVRSEDRLLRERFGDEFEDYARDVPALWPRLITSSPRPSSPRRPG